MTDQEIRDRIAHYKFYHVIPLTETISTPGNPDFIKLQQPIQTTLAKIDLRGKRVLDVGCRDGLFSFQAELAGAAEVIGIDNDLSRGACEFLIPFFQSSVKMHECNLYDLSTEMFGRFDVVIFAGVLYHLRYPFHAFRILREVLQPGGSLLLETAIFHGCDDHAMLWCPIGTDSPYEPTSCTFFNKKGLVDSLASLGFRCLSEHVLDGGHDKSTVLGKTPVIDRAVFVFLHEGRPGNTLVDQYWHATHSIQSDVGHKALDEGLLDWGQE